MRAVGASGAGIFLSLDEDCVASVDFLVEFTGVDGLLPPPPPPPSGGVDGGVSIELKILIARFFLGVPPSMGLFVLLVLFVAILFFCL